MLKREQKEGHVRGINILNLTNSQSHIFYIHTCIF